MLDLDSDQGVRGSAPGDTQLSLGTPPTLVSGVLDLGDRTKNTGGTGHRPPSVVCSNGVACKVVAIIKTNILFLYFIVA